ncbi:Phosphoglucosamine mutase [Frankliniella fusca]|uniref:Phosphoglucosamine mutase n=1 Tax=Frankliniella fusca TaxID=407009 RepID=A0AAE1HAY7_9NEOP|nr:Phosphoglucosamine mutase [Frankliniella fusca]
MRRKPGTKSRAKRFYPPRRTKARREKDKCTPPEECIDGKVSPNKSNPVACFSQSANPGGTSLIVGQETQSFPQSSPSSKDILRVRKENVEQGKSTESPNSTSSVLSLRYQNTVVEVPAASLLPVESVSVKDKPVEDIEVFLTNADSSISHQSQATELVQLSLDTIPKEEFIFVENQDCQQVVLHSDISLVEASCDVICAESPSDNAGTDQDIENKQPPTANSIVAVPASDLNFSQLWQQVETYVVSSKELPSHWQTKVENNCFYLMGMSRGLNKVVQRSIAVKHDRAVTVLVHGKFVPADHTQFWEKLPPIVSSTPRVISAVIIMIFKELRNWYTCIGIPDEPFSDKYRNCLAEEGFDDFRFKKTLRSTACLLLVRINAKRCIMCAKLLRAITNIKNRKAKLRTGTPKKKKA